MVEFALVGPIVLLLLLILLDFGRGLFYYTEMAAGAREAARQGTLLANQNSNTAPAVDALPSVRGVLPQLQSLAVFGYGLEPYANCRSSSPSGPPARCGTYAGSTRLASGGWGPGQVNLASGADTNLLYVFVYELDPASGSTTWDTGASPVRTGGHKLVVVDLKLRWTPAVLRMAGLGPQLTFDSVSAQREEW